MQGIFQKENTDKALKYGIYRHLPTYEKIIRNLVSFFVKKYDNSVGCYLRKRYESAKILSEKEFKEELDHVLFDSETYR